jgi:hypothetical protein
MTEYSQETQIYLMNYLKDYEYSDVYDEFKKLSPFASDYFSKKFELYLEVYDIRKNKEELEEICSNNLKRLNNLL